MKVAMDFLSLRPIWTRHALEAVWYAYLAETLIKISSYLNFSYSAIGSVTAGYHISLFSALLSAIVYLALVRMFLEIALKLLVKPHEETLAQGT